MISEPGEELPVSIAYREMVNAEADRLYGVIALLLGQAAVAESLSLDAWRRVWQAYDRGQIFGDEEELLYRWGIRSALNRQSRSSDLRGYQPPTTGDDHWVTVMGIVQRLSPQQRAAVLLTIWGGVQRRTAALATAISEERVAEAAFVARQEYRLAKGAPPPELPDCHEMGPLLAAQRDGTISSADESRVGGHLATCSVCQAAAAAYREFDEVLKGIAAPAASVDPVDAALDVPAAGPARPQGLRRVAGLASGPFVLTLVLIAAVLLFRDCGEVSIKAGAGRTSDLIFARDGAATIVLDAGSGREAGRLGLGVLSADGERLYGTRTGCRGQAGATAIWLGDLGTFQTTDVGCVGERVAALAVDGEEGLLYLTDAQAERLMAFDLKAQGLDSRVLRADGLARPFAPETALTTASRSILLTIASGGDADTTSLVRTDLRSLTASTRTLSPDLGPGSLALTSSAQGERVWIYEVDGGRIREVTSNGATRLGRLSENSPRSDSSGARTLRNGALALSPDGARLFAVLSEGGIAVVSVERLEVDGTFAPESRYTAVAASTDGRYLFALQTDGTYVVLDAATGAERLRRARVQGREILQVNAGD